jgi:phage FluMu protein Com
VPIVFDCPCGKTLRVADEHAGRRVKCPACHAVGLVPQPEPQFEVVEQAPPPPPKPTPRPPAFGPDGSIVFDCACGMALRVAAEQVGRRVKCPMCQAVSTVTRPKPPGGAESAAPTVRFELTSPTNARRGPMVFRCSCGRLSQMPAGSGGRRVECGGCYGVGVVPTPPPDEDDSDGGTYQLGPPVCTLDNPTGLRPRGRPGMH